MKICIIFLILTVFLFINCDLLDSILSVVVIDSPKYYQIFHTDWITVDGWVNEYAEQIDCYAHGVHYGTTFGTSFIFDVWLEPGENYIEVEAYDSEGNFMDSDGVIVYYEF